VLPLDCIGPADCRGQQFDRLSNLNTQGLGDVFL
jgi:hypothetical protein